MSASRPPAALIGSLLAVLLAAQPRLPEPPLPPKNPPSNEIAPVPAPNDSGAAPAATPDRSRVDLRFFRAERPDASQGFTPGSHYQTSDERKQTLIPGFLVRIPLTYPGKSDPR